MHRLFPVVVLLAAALSPVAAQTPAHLPPPAREIFLYDGPPPGSETWDWQERTFVTRRGNTVTQNVVRPALLHYPADPAKACGTAVIVAPGGGFTSLMALYEGTDIARQLNALGVDAFILKYRLIYVDPAVPLPPLGASPTPAPRPCDDQGVVLAGPQQGQNIFALAHADTARAVTWLRAHAGEFRVRPGRIGIIGFSAGGFVALAVATGPAGARPDFAAAIYGPGHGVITPPADAPPLFVAAAADDAWAADGSVALFSAWRRAGRLAELHLFQTGGHGFQAKGGGADHFMDRLGEWMKVNGWLAGPEP